MFIAAPLALPRLTLCQRPMIVWIAAGLAALGALWAINRVNTLRGKTEGEVRSFLSLWRMADVRAGARGAPPARARHLGRSAARRRAADARVVGETNGRLDYDRLIHLDAENLAEQGIGKAYSTLLPALRPYVTLGAPVEEVTDTISEDSLRRWPPRARSVPA